MTNVTRIRPVKGWVCMARIYEYKGWLFEVPGMDIPWPLKKDGEPRKRAGNKFWNMYSEFERLTDNEQEKYRVAGGCLWF